MVSGAAVVTAPEEIDIANAAELRAALLEAAAHGNGTLVVNMLRTQFCDSAGLGPSADGLRGRQSPRTSPGGGMVSERCRGRVHYGGRDSRGCR
jgi:hypothetical protein